MENFFFTSLHHKGSLLIFYFFFSDINTAKLLCLLALQTFCSCPSGATGELKNSTVSINLHRLDFSFSDDFRYISDLSFSDRGGLHRSQERI